MQFSDNEDDNIIKNQGNSEDIKNFVAENVLLFNKTNKPKENIKFRHLKDEEYEFNGITAKLSVIDNHILGKILIKFST